MSWWQKRSLLESGALQGWTDCHSHILPGVDDGVRSLEEALDVLAWYEEQRIRSVWLTPHVMTDYPNGAASLRDRFGLLKEAWRGNVSLHLAAEYMLDSQFEDRLDRGDELLPFGEDGDRLLVETSCLSSPLLFDDLLDAIRSKGYFPLLAHPERYLYLSDSDYRRLHDAGVEFQLNLLSLCGVYGAEPGRKARKLLKAGYYACVGSDLHHLPFFQHFLSRRLFLPSGLLQLMAGSF